MRSAELLVLLALVLSLGAVVLLALALQRRLGMFAPDPPPADDQADDRGGQVRRVLDEATHEIDAAHGVLDRAGVPHAPTLGERCAWLLQAPRTPLPPTGAPLFPPAQPVSWWWQEPLQDDPAQDAVPVQDNARGEVTSAGRPRRCAADPTTVYFADSPTTPPPGLPSLGLVEDEPTRRENTLMGLIRPVSPGVLRA